MSVELFESAELSDVGRKRKNNEDAFLRIPDKGVYCVADGMGGVAGGDLASEAITTNVHETFANALPEEYQTLSGTVKLLRAAANKASKWIKEFADEKVIGQMGSTFVALVFDPRNPARARALHAGDSRVYRWREGKLEQLTTDHTAALALAAKLGRDPSTFPAKYHNELARAVGLKEAVELEETKVQAKSRDVFLLCCDGLYRMAADQEIGKVLSRTSQEDLGQMAKGLINLANEAGGKDNITVVLVRIGDLSALAGVEERDTDEPLNTTAALVVPEPEMDIKAQEDPNRITPDTAEAGEATPPDEVSLAPKNGGPPDAKPRPNRMPWIAGAVVALALVIVLVVNHYKHKSETLDETGGAPNASVPDAAAPNSSQSSEDHSTTPATTTGSLVIQSQPTGAEVFSDGVKVGITPYETNGLSVGQWTYQLGTTTRTGAVVAVITAGSTNTSKVTLTPRTGTLAITSDPDQAQVWVDGLAKGTTPSRLQLEAGERQLVLKHPPLEDLEMTLTMAANQEIQTNAAFAYGSVELQSEPAGAGVSLKGSLVGHAPFTAGPLPPGPAVWQMSLTDYTSSNVTIQVPADGSRATNLITLQRGRGWLRLSVSPPEAQVWLDGVAVSNLSGVLPVDAGRTYALMAEFNQQRTNTTVTVKMDQTLPISLVLDTNGARPVAVAAPVTSHVVAGHVGTNNSGLVTWTNHQGMTFVKMPAERFWVQTARVTPQQFEQVAGPNYGDGFNGMDDNQPCAVVSLKEAQIFAEKLTDALKKRNDLPAGYEQWHLDILTPDQWKSVGDKSKGLGIGMKKLEQAEWASGVAGPEKEAFSCSYKPNVKPVPVFFAYQLGPQQAQQARQAFRLALVE